MPTFHEAMWERFRRSQQAEQGLAAPTIERTVIGPGDTVFLTVDAGDNMPPSVWVQALELTDAAYGNKIRQLTGANVVVIPKSVTVQVTTSNEPDATEE